MLTQPDTALKPIPTHIATAPPPRGGNNRVVSHAFSTVSRDPDSTGNAAYGTPQASAIRRMISASGVGPVPPPERSSSGAAPARNRRIPQSSRRTSPAEERQPSATTVSAFFFRDAGWQDQRSDQASAVIASAPLIRAASAAARKRSISPSSTAPVFPVSTPVRRSFTI